MMVRWPEYISEDGPKAAHEIVRTGGDRDFAVYLAKLALDLAANAGADPREVDAIHRALATV